MKNELRLSDSNRNLIVTLVLALLLIFGPIEPYGIIFRSAYLIIIPTILWLILRYWGEKWSMNYWSNDYLNRSIFVVIASILLIGAYLSFTDKNHLECEQYVGRGEGGGCVDYIMVKGPSKGGAIMSTIFAGVSFWWAFSKRKKGE